VRVEEGLRVLAEALALADKTGERWYEVELDRLYGELSLRIGEAGTGRNGDQHKRERVLFSGSSVLSSSARFPFSPDDSFLKAIGVARKNKPSRWNYEPQ
jgi:hypothetical protein